MYLLKAIVKEGQVNQQTIKAKPEFISRFGLDIARNIMHISFWFGSIECSYNQKRGKTEWKKQPLIFTG